MNWYYIENDQQTGPVPQAEFDGMVRAGRITADTKVWRDGMGDWARYADLLTVAAAPAAGVPAGSHRCAECGNIFADSDMIAFENAWVCATCKPVFVQKLKEGIAPTLRLNYAGFWIRVAAYLIDFIVLTLSNTIIRMAFHEPLIGVGARARLFGPAYFVGVAFGVFYMVFFNGRFGATPGKMALKLKIVRPDGSPIGYLRALGRYFAQILSGIILCIGFMMIGWDSQKRGLHDMICDTRVIYR